MIVAVIPVKKLGEGKSRLAGVMTVAGRRALSGRLVARTVAAVRACPSIERIALVTVEEDLARSLGVEILVDRGSLNASLEAGIQWAIEVGALAVLILPADLARVSSGDIEALCDALPLGDGIVIAPTNDGGTGALLLSPPDVVPPMFGPDSFRRHQSTAAIQSIDLRMLTRPGLALDLDTPDDLASLLGEKKKIADRIDYDRRFSSGKS